MSSHPAVLPSLPLRNSFAVGFIVLAALATSTGCGRRDWGGEDIASQTANLVTSNNTITQAADEARTGWFWDQPQLDPATVGSTNFKRLFKTQLLAGSTQQILAQPLVVDNGAKVLVATEENNLYLVDSQTGAVSNQRNLGAGFDANALGCGDVIPHVGVTGTPVVDAAANIAYFYSKNNAGAWSFHAINTADLSERAGFPVTIGGAADNDPTVTFNSTYEMQRPGLLLMNGVVYAGFGAHCDIGSYRGWIVGVSTAGVVKARFATVAKSTATKGNGVWMSGSGLASDGAGKIVFATGNGYANPAYPGATPGNTPPGDLEEAVVRVTVQADGTLKSTDFFAPFNATALNGGDSDLGSGGVVLLPSQFGTAAIPHLAVIAGKGGSVYLLNRDSLGGFMQGPNSGDAALAVVPLGGSTWSRPAVWPGEGGYVYFTTNGGTSTTGHNFQVLKYGTDSQGKPTITLVGKAPDNVGAYSGSPIVTSNGTNAGSALVWMTNQTSELRVYDAVPVNGTLNIRFRDAYGNQAKFTTIGVGAGKVYIGSGDGFLVGYGAGTPAVSGNPVDFGTVTVGQNKQLTATLTANQNVTVTALSATNGVFTLGAPSRTLPAAMTTGQTLTVPVTFAPTSGTNFSASLNITTNATPGAVTLIGIGQVSGPQLTATPASVNFGGVATGTSSSLSVQLKNTGSSTLTFSGFTGPAAPFSASGVPANGATLAAGASVSVTTTYSPTAAGTATGNLIVNSNGGNVNIPLTGTSGTPPQMVITPLANDFGTVAIGANKTMSFTIKNTGGLDLTINKSKPPALGNFVAQTTLSEGSTVKAGQTVTETVSFSSSTVGSFSDNWQITGSDTSGLQVVTFTATVGSGAVALSRTGWVASASATAGNDVPANALDGNAGTRWSSGQPQSGTATQSFTVDMLAAQTFTQITMDSAGDYSRSYQVYASSDGTNWGAAIATGTATANPVTVTFAQQTARFLQIRQLPSAGTTSWWSIWELNVYGTSGGGTLTALPRTGWTATGSATGDPPANAIDGNINTRWSTTAAQVPGQFFEVDMQTAKTFRQITLDAAGSAGDYPRGYQIFVSSDGTNWGSAIAAGNPTTALVTITFSSQTARFIKVVQTGTVTPNWWSLYEFNVYN
jgi:hypothetical protein